MLPKKDSSRVSILRSGAANALFMCVLFFLECEHLLRMPEHHEVRKALRALLGIPAHDILFAALVFAFLAKLLVPNKFPALKLASFSLPLTLLHVAYAVCLDFSLIPLYQTTLSQPYLEPLWFPILAGFALSWLACVIRPGDWLATFNAHGRWLAVSIVAGAFTVYFSKSLAEIWYFMPEATMWATEKWLVVIFGEVVRGPGRFTIGSPMFQIDVGAPCSGYEGMALMLCYLSCFLWLKREQLRFPSALLLLPIGVALSWLANTARIAILVVIGSYWSPKLALDGFHTQAGWLSFTILGVVLVAVVEHFGIFKKQTDKRQLPALPYLLPLLTLFLLQIASAAFTDQFDFYYPVRAIILAGVLLGFRHAYAPLLGRPTMASVGCGLAVYVLWLLLATPSEGVDPSEYLSGSLLLLWLSARVIGAVILIPLIEELAFRGFLLRRLQSRDFSEVPVGQLTVLSVAVSSIAFGILHSDWLAGIIAGVAYALVLRGKRDLSDAVVAHGVTNFCLAAQVLLTRDWGYW